MAWNIPILSGLFNNISSLGNNPNVDDQLSPDELKAKFDKAGQDIQTYINNTMIPAIKSTGAAAVHTHVLSDITDYEIDATPTDDSQNPVMSGGVFDALAAKENTLDSKQKRSIYISSTEPTGQWQDGDIWLKTVE